MEDIVFVKITRGIDCRLSLSVVSGSKNKKQQPNRQTSVLRILYFQFLIESTEVILTNENVTSYEIFMILLRCFFF